MNKAELIAQIAEDAGISKAQANVALDSFTASVQKTLKKDGKVTLVGFGTFSVSKRKARKGRNPKTGEEIKIGAKKVAHFKAGLAFTSTLNPTKTAPKATTKAAVKKAPAKSKKK